MELCPVFNVTNFAPDKRGKNMNKEASEEPVKFASKARGSIVCVCEAINEFHVLSCFHDIVLANYG